MESVLLTKILHHHGIYYKLSEFRVTHIRRHIKFFLPGWVNSFQIIWDNEIPNTELTRFNSYSILGNIKLALY
jgi:hypothetical protein